MSNKESHRTAVQFLNTVEQTIIDYDMFSPGDAVLAGVSGGPDSVALLDALSLLVSRFAITLGIAHLDHGLRKDESQKDAAFVSNLASTYNLPFYMEAKDVAAYQKKHKLSLEDAARKVRYDFLMNLSKKEGFTKIALAHHADDNAELILMNLIRGSGSKGLGGIPAVRSNMVVRPLIRCYRSDIMAFLSRRKLDYVIDATNNDKRFTRNRIRLDLIPMLQTYNPKITETLNKMGSIIQHQEVWIQSLVEEAVKDIIIKQNNTSMELSSANFEAKSLPLKQRLVRQAIHNVKGDLKRISHDHIEAIISLKNKGQIHLPGRVLFEKKTDMLRFSKLEQNLRTLSSCHNNREPISFEYTMFKSRFKPMTLFIKETGAHLRFSQIKKDATPDYTKAGQAVAFFDMKQIKFPIIIRNVTSGDKFVPLGMTGAQKVTRFFINNKISRLERIKCPILLCRGEIIWLAGYRMSDLFKVTDTTDTILKAELLLA